MDIEELSKAQLLLLTVMVNFVVSIATGVLTVSLLDQAPLQVSQGVDRVVEKTIQTIATPVQVVNPIKSITTTQSPSSPSNEQLMTAAIGSAASRTVLIHKGATTSPAIAFGTYLPKSRAIVTANVPGLPKQAIIRFSDGSSARASVSKTSAALVIYGFGDDTKLPDAPAAGLPVSSKLKQGQSVLSLTKDSAAVTGIISKVGPVGIETSLTGVPVGAGAVDLSGQVVGIGSPTVGVLIPAEAVTTLLESPADT
jgi:hypothetical protein